MRKYVLATAALAAATALTMSSCTSAGARSSGRESAVHPAGLTAGGLWAMDGYGTAVSVGDRELTTYDTTAVSCLPGSLTGQRKGAADNSGGTRTYTALGDRDITVTPRRDGTARLRIETSEGSRTLHRIKALPALCARKGATDPRAVFDVFWQTFAENYPFFAAKGINWTAVRARYRPTVTKDTTDDELFAVLRKMIAPLHDAHTVLTDGAKRDYTGARPGTPDLGPGDLARVDAIIQKTVGVPLKTRADGALSYTTLPGGTGYLRITRFISYTDELSYPKWVAELGAALDAIPWQELHGLVLDVRTNSGGADPLGLQVAARLTGHAYTAYTKYARDDPRDPTRFTAGQPITVQPYAGPHFTGPVAVLTGPSTVSAGETFTQALLGRSPAPLLIGQNTQGVFSDTLDRALPNGWRFQLPDEEYRTATGTTFDGAGIPPRYREPVFTQDELAHDQDSALTTALHLLGARAPSRGAAR